VAYDVAGKKVLVTGGSSGIGADLARGFAEGGATVGICARRTDRLQEVLEICRKANPDGDHRMWTIDLSDLDAVQPFARQADDELGGIDVLINNAGIPKRRKVTELRLDEVDSLMTINYLSPVRLTLALLPRMLERGGGRVVTISSIAAHLAPPSEAAYAATKAAITAFVESAAVDLWDSGIRFHLVNPGIIETELFDLPDNDKSMAGDEVPPLPPSALTEAVLRQLDDDTFEINVPDWFKDVIAGKAQDTGVFLAGSAAWLAQKNQATAGA
jgi:NAD(P)-dependent dehydrogenase (short-subunit alcohol dehydrogenase family)